MILVSNSRYYFTRAVFNIGLAIFGWFDSVFCYYNYLLLDFVVLIAALRQQNLPHIYTSSITFTMSGKVLSLVTRLSGQANYDIWCIRMKAALTEKEVAATIKPDAVFTTAEDEKASINDLPCP